MLRERPLVMGVVNVTPDSFSDGCSYSGPAAAAQTVLDMTDAGADIVDIGGESTRPGARPVSKDEELRRVIPVLEILAGRCSVPISVDTSKAAVADIALKTGADIVNDVSAGRWDEDMLAVVADRGAAVVLMHTPGPPERMMELAHYDDLVKTLVSFFEERCSAAIERGVSPHSIVVDPGIGFGKLTSHNLQIIARLRSLQNAGVPLMLGLSRKRFVGEICGIEDPRERDSASAAAYAVAAFLGVDIVRTHDVTATLEAVTLGAALRHAGEGTP